MSKEKVIVTGASGYIGGSTAFALKEMGHQPILLDRLPLPASSPLKELPFFRVDLQNQDETLQVFKKIGKAQGVIHFAALALVGESVEDPGLYFRNNVLSTLHVAEAAIRYGIQKFVYSSSCSVYGIPKNIPITEEEELHPISPYGESKLMGEKIIYQLCRLQRLQALCLRYFNPAGSLNFEIGENHQPETHLIPNVVRAALCGEAVQIFGTDYETPDGTCIRDFIHIEDLARAHILALAHMTKPQTRSFQVVNLGSGTGYSVNEVLQAAEKAIGCTIQTKICDRRTGDPPKLVADNKLARWLLEWKPEKGLDEMIRSHTDWVKKLIAPKPARKAQQL